jgi:hypothetical protein
MVDEVSFSRLEYCIRKAYLFLLHPVFRGRFGSDMHLHHLHYPLLCLGIFEARKAFLLIPRDTAPNLMASAISLLHFAGRICMLLGRRRLYGGDGETGENVVRWKLLK